MQGQQSLSAGDRLDLQTLLALIKRRRWHILSIALVSGLLAFGLSLLQSTTYEASAGLLFKKADYAQTLFGSSSTSGSTDPQREAATDLALSSLQVVTERAKAVLHSPLTIEALRKRVAVDPVGEADIVNITAHADTRSEAVRIANVFANQVVALRRQTAQEQVQSAIDSLGADAGRAGGAPGLTHGQLSVQLSKLKALKALQTGNVEVVQPATRPLHPSAPKPLRNGVIGGGAGLIVGILAMLLLRRLDRRVHDSEELAELLGSPLFATLPLDKPLGAARSRAPAKAEQFFEIFHFLRANLQLQEFAEDSRVLAISSPLPGDGKTTVVTGLARALAGSGARVIVVDCDLRRPMLSKALGVPRAAGLSEVLVSGDDPLALLQDTHEDRLRLLGAGNVAVSPALALGVPQLGAVVNALMGEADYVLLDTPPIQVAAEASSVAAVSDGVVLVVDISRATRNVLVATRRQLAHSRLLGVVVNRAEPSADDVGYYYYAPEAPSDRRVPGARPRAHALESRSGARDD